MRYEPLRRADKHGFQQQGGVLAAIDDKTRRLLRAIQLFATTFDAAEERDAQEVGIEQLDADPARQSIIATDERKRVWLIDIMTRKVTAAPNAVTTLTHQYSPPAAHCSQ